MMCAGVWMVIPGGWTGQTDMASRRHSPFRILHLVIHLQRRREATHGEAEEGTQHAHSARDEQPDTDADRRDAAAEAVVRRQTQTRRADLQASATLQDIMHLRWRTWRIRADTAAIRDMVGRT